MGFPEDREDGAEGTRVRRLLPGRPRHPGSRAGDRRGNRLETAGEAASGRGLILGNEIRSRIPIGLYLALTASPLELYLTTTRTLVQPCAVRTRRNHAPAPSAGRFHRAPVQRASPVQAMAPWMSWMATT